MDYKILLEKVTEVLRYQADISVEGMNNMNATDVLSRVVLFEALLKCPWDVLMRLGDSHDFFDMTSNESLIHAVLDHPNFNCYMLMNTGSYEYA